MRLRKKEVALGEEVSLIVTEPYQMPDKDIMIEGVSGIYNIKEEDNRSEETVDNRQNIGTNCELFWQCNSVFQG